MVLQALAMLGSKVRQKRGSRKLREAAAEIGVSAATLLRVESGRIPDVETFGKLCRWLGEHPNNFLGLPSGNPPSPTSSLRQASAHFKADRHPNLDTAAALAKMILYVSENQPAPTERDE
jgi:transcriptional regulator with XRE-family HTH domain